MADFFVSYNSADRSWAEWIAYQLEAAGYTTTIQAWDFRPGSNFVLDMQRAATESNDAALFSSSSRAASTRTRSTKRPGVVRVSRRNTRDNCRSDSAARSASCGRR